jgi:hypothetical protein
MSDTVWFLWRQLIGGLRDASTEFWMDYKRYILSSRFFLLTSGNICSVHINMLRHARNYTIDILFWVSGFELFVHGIVIPLIISWLR